MSRNNLAIFAISLAVCSLVHAEEAQPPEPATPLPLATEGMDNTRLQALIENVDPEFTGQSGSTSASCGLP
jgi:hypothetical protein